MKRQRKNNSRRWAAFLLMAACIVASLTGCGQTQEEEVMSEVIPIQVQTPEAGELTLQNEFVGTISPEESVYVISMVSAEVLSTNVAAGDVVNAGDVLCELDSEAAQLQLASAQAQYDNAAAGVNSAEVGYEIAQSQYEGTVAQLDAQLGGQKNLQLYQLQVQVDTINSGIEDIHKQIDSLDASKKTALEQKDNLEYTLAQANVQAEQAANEYYAALAEVTYLEPGDWVALQQVKGAIFAQYQEQYKDNPLMAGATADTIYEYELARAKENLKTKQAVYEQTNAAASQMRAAYEQADAGIKQIDDGKAQLNDTLSDTYDSLEQAEAIKNITEEQVYSDTQKIVDANKKTAALSLDSAAATVNSAQVGIEGAQVAIDSAEYQLDMYTIKAPISGVIEAANVKEHDFATPNSPAYVISNKDTMMVTFYVSEGIRNTLSVGQKVDVDRNGSMYRAAITEIGSMIDQNTGLFAIKACVDNPDESLLTGCSVKVTADTYRQGDVLLIPYDAVYYDGSQPYVYVAVNGVAERKDIETGIFDEQTITVVSGLTVEDQLITSWSANLREGAEVSIQETQDAEDSDAGDTAESEE